MHAGQDSAVALHLPEYVLFDFLDTKGDVPPARWGHTAVVINQKLFVYGGEGSQPHCDLQLFEPGGTCAPLLYGVIRLCYIMDVRRSTGSP